MAAVVTNRTSKEKANDKNKPAGIQQPNQHRNNNTRKKKLSNSHPLPKKRRSIFPNPNRTEPNRAEPDLNRTMSSSSWSWSSSFVVFVGGYCIIPRQKHWRQQETLPASPLPPLVQMTEPGRKRNHPTKLDIDPNGRQNPNRATLQQTIQASFLHLASHPLLTALALAPRKCQPVKP
ncbi:hypothetical protein VTJ04DRAFT_3729 [Mycothermus thermophilus]|uniref:uncharacterized protein n=1 Tax=Humicola insolens TaxID=85995 RepID=UPI003744107A